jgi:hypothetical protein
MMNKRYPTLCLYTKFTGTEQKNIWWQSLIPATFVTYVFPIHMIPSVPFFQIKFEIFFLLVVRATCHPYHFRLNEVIVISLK